MNVRYTNEPIIKLLFEIVGKAPDKDENKYAETVKKAKICIKAIQEMDEARQAIYLKSSMALGEEIKFENTFDSITNLFNRTVLEIACENGHIPIVDALLEAGANPNKGCPLYKAASGGHTLIVNALLKAEADPNITNELFEIPLIGAVLGGHTLVVDALLKAGAIPNILVKLSNLIPLHIAASRGYVDIVILLLDAGVKINSLDSLGKTALEVAKDLNMIALLVQRGASISNPSELLTTLIHSDPCDPNVLYLLDRLAKSHVSNVISGDLTKTLDGNEFKALNEYHHQLIVLGEHFQIRTQLKDALKNVLPASVIDIVRQYDTPLSRLTFFVEGLPRSHKEEVAKHYETYFPAVKP